MVKSEFPRFADESEGKEDFAVHRRAPFQTHGRRHEQIHHRGEGATLLASTPDADELTFLQ